MAGRATTSSKKAAPAKGRKARVRPREDFPIVGVGASAGGYEAFRQLLEQLPPDTGMAFVLVQHLDPHHESQLTDLLARATKMPILETRDHLRLQPDHVYVLAPNTSAVVARGVLRVTAREATGRNLPVDLLFQSLAADRARQAIGVVLSGTASDGAAGVQALKIAGGITFAQDEASAKYPDMPRNAAATGCVDFVLPPAGIAEELVRLSPHTAAPPAAGEEAFSGESLLPLFRLLWLHTGVDFLHYKAATIQRRIRRRMAVHRVRRLAQYTRLLRERPGELDALYADLLINVTGFFRDPDVYAALKKKVFPRLVRRRTGDTPIRIWVPGCSTGEEAYSLAIALLEHLGAGARSLPIQIFATDISPQALEKARAGFYPDRVTADLSPAQRRRFFVREPGGYRVSKAVRELCVFAPHDLIKDPPFSNLDLVSCRNVLIYLGPMLQRRVLPIFHYALRPDGHLLLGKSETVNGLSNLFKVVDRRRRIYAPKPAARRHPFELAAGARPPVFRVGPPAAEAAAREPDVRREADQLLVGRFAPASVLVNEDLEVLQFRGHTGPFLEHASGAANLNLLHMVRDDLAMDLRTAFAKARRRGLPVRRATAKAGDGDAGLEVIPLRTRAGERHFLVLFGTGAAPTTEPAEARGPETGRERQTVARLRQELAALRAAQREVVHELETANEEFRAVNEEFQSNNEELQSTNEELETAKEEMQSANEELSTVNEELQTRSAEIQQLNDDLLNLLTSVNIPIVLLGPNQRIRRFTVMAGQVLGLVPADVGRPLSGVRLPLDGALLDRMIADALADRAVKECEVQLRDGRWHALQVRPYRSAEHRIEGAVLVLWDTDAARRGAAALRSGRDFAEAIVATARSPLLVLGSDLGVHLANDAFCRLFGISKEACAPLFMPGRGTRPWNRPKLRNLLLGVLRKGDAFDDLQVEHSFPGLGPRTLLLTARRMAIAAPDAPPLLLAIEDVTLRRQLEAEVLHATESERQRIGVELHDGLGQLLPGIAYLAGAVRDRLVEKGLPEAAVLKKVVRQLTQGARRVHELARGLFPVQLRRGDLAGALQELAADTQDVFGVACRFAGLDSVRLPGDPEMARQLYRIAQEAVYNAARHSKGKHIEIRLARRGARLALTVRDTGIGLPPASTPQTGLGLRIMKYRADLIGAALETVSVPGKGTTVHCLFAPDRTRRSRHGHDGTGARRA